MENDLSYTRTKIAEAMDSYDGEIDDAGKLLEHIMAALGDVETETFNGWTIRRLIGSEFKGTRGSVRKRWGYKAEHADTGRSEEFPPDSTGDVKIQIVRMILKQKDQLHALEQK